MRRAAWLRVVLSVLMIQPAVAKATHGSWPDARNPTARQQKHTYVVDFNWMQIQRLAPGTKVIVSKAGIRVVTQYVLEVTPDEVKTLAVSDMAVQFAKPLHRAAAAHPEFFVQALLPGTRIGLDDHVSLEDSGVFVDKKRVADLQEFIVTITRSEIDSGSVTVSTPPVRNQLSRSAKILIGIGIFLAAWSAYVLILVQGTD